jgi:hypothetical protein
MCSTYFARASLIGQVEAGGTDVSKDLRRLVDVLLATENEGSRDLNIVQFDHDAL